MNRSARKAEIVSQIHATHQPLEALLAGISESDMIQSGVNGEWSVKDMLAHITWWEQHLLRRLRTSHDDLDAEGGDASSTTDDVNAGIFSANRDRSLTDVRAAFDASYREVLETISALTDDELAPDETYEAIGWDTFRHYPEHTAMLHAWLDSNAKSDA